MTDSTIRRSAFDWLAEQKEFHGPVLPYAEVLRGGFEVAGQRIPIFNKFKGIFRPRQCEYPLAIQTSFNSPYEDRWSADGSLLYSYRRGGPAQHDNVGLRNACRDRIPLVYFCGVESGLYLAEFPIYVVHDDLAQEEFTLQIDHVEALGSLDVADGVEESAISRRRYLTAVMRRRMHQTSFRERVLKAYQSRCALCQLRLRKLLDAAHIKPDREGGEPVVSNGLALCKIHHTAFDRMFLGIRPDRTVQIHREVLEVEDGPMLRFGLQQLHGAPIHVPRRTRDQPDVALLTARYAVFQQAQLRL